MKVSDSDNLAYVLKHFTNYTHGTVGEESVGGGDITDNIRLSINHDPSIYIFPRKYDLFKQ